ncbi:S41 family peptidase [Litorimonas sp. RW-G-Af-16]|uniref:S41 family peptidase n=1 Tax=Litorimonas sp. RW-G-Af-16 TaxID=3241168 RepID=UPI00390C7BDE
MEKTMKYILPTLGSVAAIALFAFSTNQPPAAVAVERPNYDETFEQLELFADVLARVRSEYVVDVDNGELIEDAINGMLQSLDPHSSYVNPENFRDLQVDTSGEYGGLGMEVTMEDGFVKIIAPIDDTPAKRGGVKAGDFITEIEGKSIMGLSLNDAVNQMRGKPGEPITITVVAEGEEPRELTLVREIIKRQTVKHEVKDGIGYIRIAQFNELADSGLEDAIDSLKAEMGGKIPGLVLDLRGNPGGLLDQSIKVSSAFLDGGEVVSTRGRVSTDTERYNGEKGELIKGVPLVVLIDGASASASEIVAGAVQDRRRGIILGMTSFGKGSVQSVIPLRGGRDGALRLTTQRYYTPAGRSIQGTGIDPDIAVSAIPDDGEDHSGRKEADLPNAILNEDDIDDAEKIELKIDYPPEDFEIDDDYQLQKAISLLKSGEYATQMAELAKAELIK